MAERRDHLLADVSNIKTPHAVKTLLHQYRTASLNLIKELN
jgi:hypothetical protein